MGSEGREGMVHWRSALPLLLLESVYHKNSGRTSRQHRGIIPTEISLSHSLLKIPRNKVNSVVYGCILKTFP